MSLDESGNFRYEFSKFRPRGEQTGGFHPGNSGKHESPRKAGLRVEQTCLAFDCR